jgi:hypothetical protein
MRNLVQQGLPNTILVQMIYCSGVSGISFERQTNEDQILFLNRIAEHVNHSYPRHFLTELNIMRMGVFQNV